MASDAELLGGEVRAVPHQRVIGLSITICAYHRLL